MKKKACRNRLKLNIQMIKRILIPVLNMNSIKIKTLVNSRMKMILEDWGPVITKVVNLLKKSGWLNYQIEYFPIYRSRLSLINTMTIKIRSMEHLMTVVMIFSITNLKSLRIVRKMMVSMVSIKREMIFLNLTNNKMMILIPIKVKILWIRLLMKLLIMKMNKSKLWKKYSKIENRKLTATKILMYIWNNFKGDHRNS